MFGFFDTYRIGQISSNIIVAVVLIFAIIGFISTIAFFIRLGINRGGKGKNRYM